MRFVKPLDETLLHEIFKSYEAIISVEDGVIAGGFGSAILEFASKNEYHLPITCLGIPDVFIEHGSVEELHQAVGLDVKSIANTLHALLLNLNQNQTQ
jgi:1-deoxy-D-xylulose-5-phosphate synthase